MTDQGSSPVASTSSGGLGRDISILAVVRLASVAAGFLTSVLTARVLGPTPLGAAGVGLTAGTIAALLANGGLNIAAIYFLGRRPDERRVISSRIFTLGLATTLLAAVMIGVMGPILAPAIFAGSPNSLLAATALLAAGVVAFELSGSLLLGLDRRNAYLVTQVIEGIGSLVLVALLFAIGATTAAGYVAGAALAAALAAVFALIATRRVVHGLFLAFDRRFAREAFALGMRGQIGNVVQLLNLRLDLLLVPLFVDLRAAGIYLIAVRMSEVVSQVASAAAAFLFPAVARLDVGQTRLTEQVVRITLLVVIAGGIVIGVMAPLLLGLFFGTTYVAGAEALRITMVAMIPLALQRLLASDLKGRGRPGLVSISASFALGATVIGDLVLIPPLGIDGAAIASLVAYSTGTIVLLIAYRQITGASLMRLIPGPADARQLVATSWKLLHRRARPKVDA
jgi:stage V sporulation protein B